jgi:hypothetical protein
MGGKTAAPWSESLFSGFGAALQAKETASAWLDNWTALGFTRCFDL